MLDTVCTLILMFFVFFVRRVDYGGCAEIL